MTKYRPALRLIALAAIVAPVALSACTEVKRSLGYEKQPPDEFQVVQRAPLSMPPEFSLRPPQPGAVRPQEGTTRDQARRILTGTRTLTPITTDGRTSGDLSLMKRIGADTIQPEIRVLVDKESQALANADKSFQDRIMFWRKPVQPGAAVDAIKESQRLQENQALGKSVSDGETPQVQRRKKAWLEGVFR
jgi:hypothetical protein